MVRISKKEKEELIKAGHSRSLRASFETMRRNRTKLVAPMSLDKYIDFVSYMNEFTGHKPKKFVKMTGKHFRL